MSRSPHEPDPPLLHDLLAYAAEDAPRPSAAPAAGLWEQGTRIKSVRRRGTFVIVVACCLLLGVVGLVTWRVERPTGVTPVAHPDAVGALPSRISRPSKWLPGSAERPIGPLAAVVRATRGGLFGSSDGYIGVSALTGEYRFLDLPRMWVGQTPLLSPDGRMVAYWYTGPPLGDPQTEEGQTEPVAGLAAYDTVTGKVSYLPRRSQHGVAPESGELGWVDGTHLVFREDHRAVGDHGKESLQGSSYAAPGLESWNVASDRATVFPRGLHTPSINGWSRDGTVVLSDSRAHVVTIGEDGITARTSTTTVAHALTAGTPMGPWRLSQGARWAMTSVNTGGTQRRIEVVDLADGKRVTVPGNASAYEAVGWLDDSHVAVTEATDDGMDAATRHVALFRVDVHTGEKELLVRYPHGALGGGWAVGEVQLATDLLSVPVVRRPAPPSPLDHRLYPAAALVVVVGGAFALISWRRRARP